MKLLIKADPFYFLWPQSVVDAYNIFSTVTEIIWFYLFTELNNQNDTDKKDNIQLFYFFGVLFDFGLFIISVLPILSFNDDS